MKKILVTALEASANLHFSYVLEELKKLEDIKICGIFDKKFGIPLYESKEFSAMGFVEILPLIFKAKRALKELVEIAKTCDEILLIDSPAFNLPLAKALKKANVKAKITYYILPQVWAWKPHRVKIVEEFCDNLASILPFEKKFYSKAVYVGHPLLDEIDLKNDGKNFNAIAFLPGSRKSEISRLMPIFREILPNFKEKKYLVIPLNFKSNLPDFYGDVSGFEIVSGTKEILSKSDFAFVCSGTATLEAALIGVPFVLCYKAKAIDIFIARIFVKLKFVGLANIILDFCGKQKLHEELIQNDLNVQNLMQVYQKCDKQKFLKTCDEIRDYLSFGSAKNLAKLILEKELLWKNQ